MHDPYPNPPTLILPPHPALVAQLKVKLAIYRHRLAHLKHCRQPSKQQILGAWYAVNILEQLLATSRVEPQLLFGQLTHRQITEGYGKKPNRNAFAAWMHLLHKYVSYRTPVLLDMARLN